MKPSTFYDGEPKVVKERIVDYSSVERFVPTLARVP